MTETRSKLALLGFLRLALFALATHQAKHLKDRS